MCGCQCAAAADGVTVVWHFQLLLAMRKRVRPQSNWWFALAMLQLITDASPGQAQVLRPKPCYVIGCTAPSPPSLPCLLTTARPKLWLLFTCRYLLFQPCSSSQFPARASQWIWTAASAASSRIRTQHTSRSKLLFSTFATTHAASAMNLAMCIVARAQACFMFATQTAAAESTGIGTLASA